jgi:hypothetical protein
MTRTHARVLRSLLLLLVTAGITLATTGCDWANVGGPW